MPKDSSPSEKIDAAASNQSTKKHVVVIGGGVAGLLAAQRLRQERNISVTLVTDRDEFVFLPRLTELLGETAPVDRVVLPLHQVWHGELVKEKASLLDPVEKRLVLASGATLLFDAAVVAIGSQPNFVNTPGSSYAYAFYSKEDEEKLKEHIDRMLEADEQPGTHTFAIVGGGPTGVEASYVIAQHTAKRRPGRKVLLIERAPRILGALPENVGKAANDGLLAAGVTIMTNTAIINVTPLSVDVQHAIDAKETVPCYTTVWAAGSKPQSIVVSGVEFTPKGELSVNNNLQLASAPHIFVAGDIAAAGTPKSAQAALQQGGHAAENLIRFFSGKSCAPFAYKDRGVFIAMQEKTVGLVFGSLLKGRIPAAMRDAYYRMVLRHYQ